MVWQAAALLGSSIIGAGAAEKSNEAAREAQDKNIDYKIFSFVNIFVDSHYFEEWNSKYNTESNVKIIDKYPNTKYLWDMIDWDKWWFWKKYGGVGNWILENVDGGYDKDELSGMLGHNHPTEKACREFTKKVVSIFINNTYNKE